MALAPADFESLGGALGAAVLQFIWQGALIGVVAAVVLGCLRRASAPVRYGVACVALAACPVVFVLTLFMAQLRISTPLPGADEAAMVLAMGARQASGDELAAAPGLLIDAIGWIWVGGVLLFAVRGCLQWVAVRRLRTLHVSSPSRQWQEQFDSIMVQLGMTRRVRLLQSGLAEAPMVVGWLIPVVLMPAPALRSLTPAQLRAVLVHELSHIRRHDHLVNAAQVVIETMLFFHPAVWWLSGRIRLEREHCCDDAAVRTLEHPRTLAEALMQLESLRQSQSRVALAANGGPLMERISRILGMNQSAVRNSSRWRTLAAFAVGAIVAGAGIAHAATSDIKTNDPIVQVLRDAVSSGAMSSEQARTVFDAVVYPGSDLQRKATEKLAQIEQRINEAIDEGGLSPEEGERKLEAMRREIGEWVETVFATEVLGLTKGEAHLAKMQQALEQAVANGRISRDDADRKMIEIEQRVNLRVEYARAMEQMESDVRAKVASGELSETDARAMMTSKRHDMAMRMKYRAASEEIAAAVAAGTMSQEEAEEKLVQLRRRMAAAASQEINWDDVRRRIESAVARGDLTREEADAKYRELRASLGDDADDAEDDLRPDEDGDVQVSLDDVPEAVRKAILLHAGDRRIHEIERSPSGTYEVDCGDREFVIGPDGTFLGEEEDD